MFEQLKELSAMLEVKATNERFQQLRAAMQQKFAGAFGFEVGTVSMAVGGDVKRV